MKERGREQLVANVRQPFVMLGYRVLVHRSDFINSRAEHLRRVRMLAYLPSNCQPNTCYPNNPTIANFAQRPRIYKHIDNRPHREIFHSRQSFSRFYTDVAAKGLHACKFSPCIYIPRMRNCTVVVGSDWAKWQERQKTQGFTVEKAEAWGVKGGEERIASFKRARGRKLTKRNASSRQIRRPIRFCCAQIVNTWWKL